MLSSLIKIYARKKFSEESEESSEHKSEDTINKVKSSDGKQNQLFASAV